MSKERGFVLRMIAILLIALRCLFATAEAQSWPGPTFQEFSGENNGGPSDSLIGTGLDWNRPGYGYYPSTYCIYWSYLEPSRGTWDLTHLTNYGTLIQSWPTGSSNTLVLLDGWPSWEPSNNPSAWLPDWTNYVDKVVRYLYAPPFNCRYFQVWNEAFPNNGGFWSDPSWSDYFNYVHLPAAQVIHGYPGTKVVYGGYPSRTGASVDDYTNQLTIYNAWSSIDALDLHYYTPSQWSRLRAAADSRGFTNMAIWESEVGVGGYSSQPNSYIANEYARAFAWALTNNWNTDNKYKWIYYSSWAGDGSGLYSGSPATLTCHGQQLQELGSLLGTNVLTPYFGITGSLSGLSQANLPNNSTSVEAVRTGNRIIAFVHLSPTDWTNNVTISLTFPIANSSVVSAQRIDLTGTAVNLTTSGTTASTVSVSAHDATGSSALAWNNVTLATGRSATFYLLLTVSDTLPSAPSSLSAAGGNLVVNLSWTQSTSPGITGNNVYRSTTGSGGPYNPLTNLAATISYSDGAVAAGSTYFYSVSAVNSNGESGLSAYAGTTTTPAPPTGLSAAWGSGQVGLNWTGSSGATSYNVKRATGSGGPYTTIGTSSSTSYADATVVNGATYYYVVAAVNGSGESANSAEASTTNQCLTPAVPAGLMAVAGDTQVSLSWTAVSGAASYNVYRSTTSGGPYISIATGVATTNNTDTSVVDGTTYYYVVSAVNACGEGAASAEVSGTPSSAMIYQAENATLSGVVASSLNAGYTGTGYADYQNTSGDYIEWTVSAGVAGTYQIVVRYANGATGDRPLQVSVNGVVVNSGLNFPVTGAWTTWFTVTNSVTLNAGNNTVRLTDIGYSGGNLDYLQVFASGGGSPPSTPTGLTAAAGNAQVDLSWTGSSGATSYNVKRATVSGGSYTTIGTSATVSYTDTAAANGTTYYYVVSAVNGSGESANSLEVSATPNAPQPPAAPTNLTASSPQKRKITLNWTQSGGGNITNNKIYRATVNGGPYSLLATIAAATSYSDTGLTSGTTYYYVVTAINSSNLESAYSTQASATSK